MKKELILRDNIDKSIKNNNGNVFPLSPTHRKELRQLRDRNIGDLKTQIRTIKLQKLEEYSNKYIKELKEELKTYENTIKELNDDFINMIININKLIEKRKNLENIKLKDFKNFRINRDYTDISNLQNINYERKLILNIEEQSKVILESEFKEKYGEVFDKFYSEIDKIQTQYEEAINFGDLLIVKKLYYEMKNADKFLEKIRLLEIK